MSYWWTWRRWTLANNERDHSKPCIYPNNVHITCHLLFVPSFKLMYEEKKLGYRLVIEAAATWLAPKMATIIGQFWYAFWPWWPWLEILSLLERPPNVLKLLDLEPEFSFWISSFWVLGVKKTVTAAAHSMAFKRRIQIGREMDLLCFKNDNHLFAMSVSRVTCRTTNHWTFLQDSNQKF